MSSAQRAKSQDQRHQPSTGRDRVGEQGNRNVSPREPFAHDAGADHGRQQERAAQRFGNQSSSARNVRHFFPSPSSKGGHQRAKASERAARRSSKCADRPQSGFDWSSSVQKQFGMAA